MGRPNPTPPKNFIARIADCKCTWYTYLYTLHFSASNHGKTSNQGANKLSKPILCLDFDGVIHSYTSGWKGADVIPDPPVPGAMEFIAEAVNHFRVAIFSSRSNQAGGLDAMRGYILRHSTHSLPSYIFDLLEWPTEKPAAFLTIDDRALTFTGKWPIPEALLDFKPWNKR